MHNVRQPDEWLIRSAYVFHPQPGADHLLCPPRGNRSLILGVLLITSGVEHHFDDSYPLQLPQQPLKHLPAVAFLTGTVQAYPNNHEVQCIQVRHEIDGLPAIPLTGLAPVEWQLSPSQPDRCPPQLVGDFNIEHWGSDRVHPALISTLPHRLVPVGHQSHAWRALLFGENPGAPDSTPPHAGPPGNWSGRFVTEAPPWC